MPVYHASSIGQQGLVFNTPGIAPPEAGCAIVASSGGGPKEFNLGWTARPVLQSPIVPASEDEQYFAADGSWKDIPQITSDAVEDALGYTPVNKAGDTMSGNLRVSTVGGASVVETQDFGAIRMTWQGEQRYRLHSDGAGSIHTGLTFFNEAGIGSPINGSQKIRVAANNGLEVINWAGTGRSVNIEPNHNGFQARISTSTGQIELASIDSNALVTGENVFFRSGTTGYIWLNDTVTVSKTGDVDFQRSNLGQNHRWRLLVENGVAGSNGLTIGSMNTSVGYTFRRDGMFQVHNGGITASGNVTGYALYGTNSVQAGTSLTLGSSSLGSQVQSFSAGPLNLCSDVSVRARNRDNNGFALFEAGAITASGDISQGASGNHHLGYGRALSWGTGNAFNNNCSIIGTTGNLMLVTATGGITVTGPVTATGQASLGNVSGTNTLLGITNFVGANGGNLHSITNAGFTTDGYVAAATGLRQTGNLTQAIIPSGNSWFIDSSNQVVVRNPAAAYAQTFVIGSTGNVTASGSVTASQFTLSPTEYVTTGAGGTLTSHFSRSYHRFASGLSNVTYADIGIGGAGAGMGSMFYSGAAGNIGVVIRGATSQTGNILEAQTVGGTAVATISAAGAITSDTAEGVAWVPKATFRGGNTQGSNAGSYIAIQGGSVFGREDGGRIYGGRWGSNNGGLRLAGVPWLGTGAMTETLYMDVDSRAGQFSFTGGPLVANGNMVLGNGVPAGGTAVSLAIGANTTITSQYGSTFIDSTGGNGIVMRMAGQNVLGVNYSGLTMSSGIYANNITASGQANIAGNCFVGALFTDIVTSGTTPSQAIRASGGSWIFDSTAGISVRNTGSYTTVASISGTGAITATSVNVGADVSIRGVSRTTGLARSPLTISVPYNGGDAVDRIEIYREQAGGTPTNIEFINGSGTIRNVESVRLTLTGSVLVGGNISSGLGAISAQIPNLFGNQGVRIGNSALGTQPVNFDWTNNLATFDLPARFNGSITTTGPVNIATNGASGIEFYNVPGGTKWSVVQAGGPGSVSILNGSGQYGTLQAGAISSNNSVTVANAGLPFVEINHVAASKFRLRANSAGEFSISNETAGTAPFTIEATGSILAKGPITSDQTLSYPKTALDLKIGSYAVIKASVVSGTGAIWEASSAFGGLHIRNDTITVANSAGTEMARFSNVAGFRTGAITASGNVTAPKILGFNSISSLTNLWEGQNTAGDVTSLILGSGAAWFGSTVSIGNAANLILDGNNNKGLLLGSVGYRAGVTFNASTGNLELFPRPDVGCVVVSNTLAQGYASLTPSFRQRMLGVGAVIRELSNDNFVTIQDGYREEFSGSGLKFGWGVTPTLRQTYSNGSGADALAALLAAKGLINIA